MFRLWTSVSFSEQGSWWTEKGDSQLFFTTHNTEILDMDFPKHSYNFLRKEIFGEEHLLTLEALQKMVTAMANLNEFESAYKVCSYIYETSLNKYGPEHPQTLKAGQMLGMLEKYL